MNATPLPIPVLVSILLALGLAITPVPEPLTSLRPEWVLLVLVYWGMAFPRHVGIFTAFAAGLALDLLQNQLLGQNALSFAFAMFVVLQLYPRLRVFPVWQQAVVVALLVVLVRLLNLWIRGATGFPPGSGVYWLPVLTSAMVWPIVYNVLRDARKRWLLHLK